MVRSNIYSAAATVLQIGGLDGESEQHDTRDIKKRKKHCQCIYSTRKKLAVTKSNREVEKKL